MLAREKAIQKASFDPSRTESLINRLNYRYKKRSSNIRGSLPSTKRRPINRGRLRAASMAALLSHRLRSCCRYKMPPLSLFAKSVTPSLASSHQHLIPYPVSFLAPRLRSSWPSSRHFATRSVADDFLVGLLRSEVDNELQEEANLQAALKGSSGPFELVDKPGTEEVMLHREYNDENVEVTCMVEMEYPSEAEEAEEQMAAVDCLHLKMKISKEGFDLVLEMECCFYRGSSEVMIDHVSLSVDRPTDGDSEKPELYDGPNFMDLDENLQRAFHDLLKSRGLTAKVATYVMDFLDVKQHREYMRWLHNVQKFFES